MFSRVVLSDSLYKKIQKRGILEFRKIVEESSSSVELIKIGSSLPHIDFSIDTDLSLKIIPYNGVVAKW